MISAAAGEVPDTVLPPTLGPEDSKEECAGEIREAKGEESLRVGIDEKKSGDSQKSKLDESKQNKSDESLKDGGNS